MNKFAALRFGTMVFLMTSLMAFYACSLNTSQDTSSSTSAAIVTCPTTSVTEVSISNYSFQPQNLTIAVNDIVKWTNSDSVAHTVTSGSGASKDGKFDSGTLTTNSTVCVQFFQAGTYPYFCNIHTYMTGVVTVQ